MRGIKAVSYIIFVLKAIIYTSVEIITQYSRLTLYKYKELCLMLHFLNKSLQWSFLNTNFKIL